MSSKPNNQQRPPLSEDLIQDLIKTEQMKVSLKLEETKIKAKEIESNERLAREGMNYQFQLEQKEPRQLKETIVVSSICALLFLAAFLGFIGYLVVNNQVAFVEKFLGWLAYIILTVGGFIAGRASKRSGSKSKTGDDIPNAEIIE